MASTSDQLVAIGAIGAFGYVAARSLGLIGGDDGGSVGSAGSITTDNMEAAGEQTSIQERGQRRALFSGSPTYYVIEDETASDVQDSEPADLPNSSTDNLAADGEDTTIQQRGERRRLFAGVDDADDSTTASDDTSSTGNLEADSEDDTTIEERGSRRARFAGSSSGRYDEDDPEQAEEDNIGRDSGTGGVSGL